MARGADRGALGAGRGTGAGAGRLAAAVAADELAAPGRGALRSSPTTCCGSAPAGSFDGARGRSQSSNSTPGAVPRRRARRRPARAAGRVPALGARPAGRPRERRCRARPAAWRTTVQCTKPPASGSMTTSASSFAPDGTPPKRSAGRSPAPVAGEARRDRGRPARTPGSRRRAAPRAPPGRFRPCRRPPHPASPMVTRRTNHQPDRRAIAGIMARLCVFSRCAAPQPSRRTTARGHPGCHRVADARDPRAQRAAPRGRRELHLHADSDLDAEFPAVAARKSASSRSRCCVPARSRCLARCRW